MIIGITGTIGAGKGTVAEYLVREKGFRYFSVRTFLNAELDKRGLPRSRENLQMIGNEMRATYGASYIMERIMEDAITEGGDAVLESVRTTGEAKYLKEHDALLWAVDADIRIRYERIRARKSETDFISFERFVAEESIENSPDPAKLNLKGVIALADVEFSNDYDEQSLFSQIEEALEVCE